MQSVYRSDPNRDVSILPASDSDKFPRHSWGFVGYQSIGSSWSNGWFLAGEHLQQGRYEAIVR